MKKRFLPKALEQCQIAEIWNEKSCDMYFSTVVYKAVKCKFEYRKFRQNDRHSKWVWPYVLCHPKIQTSNLAGQIAAQTIKYARIIYHLNPSTWTCLRGPNVNMIYGIY